MKIFVKTLKGARFEIQVQPDDSVADVKKNVENVMGVPAAEQMLIHKGKVLKDETTLEANNVSEKSTIAVIKRKPASIGTPTASASLEPQVHAASPFSTATETPTEPDWDGELDLNYEPISESNIQKILEMGGTGMYHDMAVDALRLSCNDLDKALEYLYFGLPPKQSEVPHITEKQTQEPKTPPVADQERSPGFEVNTPGHEYLRAMVQYRPSFVEGFVESLKEQDPTSFQWIQNNKAGFLRLLLGEVGTRAHDERSIAQIIQSIQTMSELQAHQTNEPNNGGDGGNQVVESEETEVKQRQELQADQTNKPNNGADGGNQGGESEETKVEVATPEDDELIAQLEAMGFERDDAVEAYLACNKNAQEAANRLLDNSHK